ncbi:hypothetical protein ACSBR2_017743 [Camellia fascicularis]
MALATVGLLIGRIVSALENNASLIGGVHDELNQLKHELASMRSFLEDADKTTVQTEGEKTGVANIRDLAYEVEDIIDKFIYCMNQQKARGKFTRCCPQHLKSLAQDLVAKCKGFPLAIVALGGVMSSKYLKSDWRRIFNSLSWELSNNPRLEVIKTTLLLSFNNLTYRLKCCFLYCCLFLEDYEIKRKRLIRLWMEKGFVEKVRRRTPEEVAESYLMELISRSMLQVVMKNKSRRPKQCKMHDLMQVVYALAEMGVDVAVVALTLQAYLGSFSPFCPDEQ